jgi:hypothetical protein
MTVEISITPSDTEFTEEEIKGFMKDAIGLKDAVDSDVLQYMEWNVPYKIDRL